MEFTGAEFQMVSKELPMHRALRETLGSLGESASDTVTLHMARKYGIFLDDPNMTLDSVAPAIYDLFGPDAGRFIVQSMWLKFEKLSVKHE